MKKLGDFVKKLLGFIGVSIACFVPTELYLLVKHWFEPSGFWQNFFLAGIAVYVGGITQLCLLIIWVALIFYFWPHRRHRRSS